MSLIVRVLLFVVINHTVISTGCYHGYRTQKNLQLDTMHNIIVKFECLVMQLQVLVQN